MDLQIIYYSKRGSDSEGDGTKAKPFRTMNRAVWATPINPQGVRYCISNADFAAKKSRARMTHAGVISAGIQTGAFDGAIYGSQVLSGQTPSRESQP